MKILFIKPPKNKISIYGDTNIEPLEFEILAATLKKHHDILILDMRIDKNLNTALKEFRPDVVGITGYTIDVYSMLGLAERIKKYNADIRVIVGGYHASLLPHDFYHPAIDLLVIGNGEVTFEALITGLEEGKNLENIPGIGINRKEGQLLTPPRPISDDLREVPIPDRSLTKKYRSQYFASIYRPLASMITSRGCPFKCKFCAIWKFMEGKYLARDVKTVADELELIEEPYVYFIDDNLTSNFKHFEALYEEIRERGIRKGYKIFGRTDAISRRPDLIEKWSKIGLKQIVLGMEAIKDEELKSLRKNNTAENNLNAIHILKQNGINIKPYLIVSQNYTKKDFDELSHFVEKMEIESPSFTILTPLPGTDLYEEVKDTISLTHYEFYDLVHSVLPTKLPRKEFYQCYSRLYSHLHSPKKYITRIIDQITGRPSKISPSLTLRKVIFCSVILPIIFRNRQYKRELLFKSSMG